MKELEKILEEIRVKAIELKNTYWADDERHLTGKGVEAMCVQAEQVIRKHMNDGWVSVEERLPGENGFYIATMDGEIVGQKESFVGLAEFEDGKWVDDEADYKCVIAWRPLPDLYQAEKIN